MQCFHPAPAEQVALPDAGIVCPLGAEVVAPAIRAGAPHDIISRLRQLFKKGAPQTDLVDVSEVIQEMVVLLA